jgi:membrane associated rhomboid family serine protease
VSQTTQPKGPRPYLPDPVVGTVLAVAVIIELLLVLADLGLAGRAMSRGLAYQYAGFWPGLLGDWEANYALQPWAMFVSYAFLHGGWLHLVVNMITLWSLGHAAVARVGRLGFVILYALSIIGGAMGYAALWTDPVPMVGASGALFGLAGAWLAWEYVDRFTARSGLWPIARVVLMLIALNVVMWWSLNGQLAWQTHLGGFITGWIAAMLIDPRPRAHATPDSDEDQT